MSDTEKFLVGIDLKPEDRSQESEDRIKESSGFCILILWNENKSMNKTDKTRQQLLDDLQELTERMTEAEETLRAILSGEVDGLVVKTAQGDRVFTLSGADHPYRIMVETMNEGAVTMAADGTILFCNQRFADIVKGLWKK